MILHLVREASTMGAGKRRFALSVKLDLAQEERTLFDRAELAREILFSRPSLVMGAGPRGALTVSGADLISGRRFEVDSFRELVEHEQGMKSACTTLMTYLDLARTFGADEPSQYSLSAPRRTLTPPADMGQLAAVEVQVEARAQGELTAEPAGESDDGEEDAPDFCYHCGAETRPGATACPECGKSL